MFWYLFLATSPVLLVTVVNHIYKGTIESNVKAKKTYLFLCGLVLFLMIALRHNSLGSVDSTGYYNGWINLRGMPYSSFLDYVGLVDMEPGYLFTVWCLSRVFPSAQFLFVLTGLLFSIAVCRVVYINSDDVMISMVMFICLGLYTFMVQGLRQGIAMAICFLSIEACKNRRLFKFLILIFLAMQFHKSAIVFLLVYFLYGYKFNTITKVGMGVVGVIFIALSPEITELGNRFLDKNYFTPVESGALVAVMTYVIILAAAFILLNEKNTNKKDVFFAFITVLGMAFYLTRYIGTQALERISFYFLIGQTILLPAVLKEFEQKTKRIISIVVCVLCVVLFMYRLKASYDLEYMFFWEG